MALFIPILILGRTIFSGIESSEEFVHLLDQAKTFAKKKNSEIKKDETLQTTIKSPLLASYNNSFVMKTSPMEKIESQGVSLNPLLLKKTKSEFLIDESEDVIRNSIKHFGVGNSLTDFNNHTFAVRAVWNVRQLLFVMNKRINRQAFRQRRREALIKKLSPQKETYDEIVKKHHGLLFEELETQ